MTARSLVIGGVSRAGKTRLARQLATDLGLSRIPGDSFITSFGWVFPKLGISHEDSYDNSCRRIRDFFIEYWTCLLRDEQMNFVFDSYHIRPADIPMEKFAGRLAFLFIGYPSLSPPDMLARVRANTSADEWTSKRADAELLDMFSRLIEQSQLVERQCTALDIPFVDMGASDYDVVHKKAYSVARSLLEDLT